MKKSILLFILFIQSSFLSAQISCYTKDAETNEIVSYVNIWVQGKEYGYTSDEKGHFIFRKNDNDESFIFSAVGYKKKTVKIKDIKEVVFLEKEIYQLSEIKILRKKKEKKEKVNILKGEKVFAVDEVRKDKSTPTIVARFFPTNDQTPFLKTIKIQTFNDLENPIFNIRFYDAAENGAPKDLLHDKNLLCTTKKGKHINTIDVSELNISIPESGIFVAVDHLHIEQNRRELEYENKQGKHVWYEPRIAMIRVTEFKDTWYNNGGEWIKHEVFSLGIELVLSN